MAQPKLCTEQKLLRRLRRDQALSHSLSEDLSTTSGKKALSTLLIYPALAGREQRCSHLNSGVELARGISLWFGKVCHGKTLLHLHCDLMGSHQGDDLA